MASILPISDSEKMNNLESIEIIKSIIEPTETIEEKTIATEEFEDTEAELSAFSQSKYYIIAGAFGEERKCKKISSKIK